MTDSPSTILQTREQSTGSNTNLWGGYLITTQRMTEQATKGYQALAVTGDATISWTNYVTGNTGECAHLKLTGSLTNPAALTFPSNMNELMVYNSAGATVTIKCSGGTGVAIPNARRALIRCDGVDYASDTPTWTGDSTTLTNNGDLVSNLQLINALAALAGVTISGLTLNSSSATQATYFTNNLTTPASGGLAQTKVNGGTASEQTSLSLVINGMTATTNVASTDQFPVYDATASAPRTQTRALLVGKFGMVLQADQTSGFTATVGNLWPCDTTGTSFIVTFPLTPSRGDVFAVFKFGTGTLTFLLNSQKFYGSTNVPPPTATEGVSFFYFTGSTRGWIDL